MEILLLTDFSSLFFSSFGLELQAAFILADKMVWECLEVDWHYISPIH